VNGREARDALLTRPVEPCPICRGERFLVRPGAHTAEAEVCACVGRCRACRGTGFVAVSDDPRAPRRRCDCQKLEGRVRAFREAGIPNRHAGSTLLSYDHSGARTAGFAAVSKWLKQFDPAGDNRGLVLWGEVGRGKTHLMVAVLRELVLRHGVRARFVEFSHLLADLRAGFDVGRGMAPLLDPLVRVEVLAIDELGKGLRTDFELNVIDELVSRRYNAMLPTLATTNYGPGPATAQPQPNLSEVRMGTAPPPSLVDRVGDRVYSRLQETSDFVHLKGEDWRARTRGRALR